MIDDRRFWLANNALVVLLHIAGIGLYATEGFSNPLAQLWAIIVIIHILEIPLAFLALANRPIPWGLTVFATLIFGFTWWVPARRGLYHG